MSFEIKLGNDGRGANFKLPVEFMTASGQKAKIEFEVISLKTSEVQDVYARSSEGNGADFIKSLAVSWDLKYPFDDFHLNDLVDRYPAVALALVQTYMEALAGFRVKN